MKRILLLLTAVLLATMSTSAQVDQNDLLTRTKAIDQDDYTAVAPTMDATLSLISARLQVPTSTTDLAALEKVVNAGEAHHQLWKRLKALDGHAVDASTADELAKVVDDTQHWRDATADLTGPEYRALFALAADDLLNAVDARAGKDLAGRPATTIRLAYLDARIAALHGLGRDSASAQEERNALQDRYTDDKAQLASLVRDSEATTASPSPLGPGSLLAFTHEQALKERLDAAVVGMTPHGDVSATKAGETAQHALASHIATTRGHAIGWMIAIGLTATAFALLAARGTLEWHRNDRDARLGDLVGGAL